MTIRRLLTLVAALGVVAAALVVAPDAKAEPIDTWTIYPGIDCLNDQFNPTRPDGTKDPNGDPLPGSPEWTARDAQRRECDNQRDHDRRPHPPFATYGATARYGEDWYRQPIRFDDIRFRWDYYPTGTSNGVDPVPAMEVYRPCSETTCPELPEGLERFEPPYPVVVIHHGFIAQMTHHRFNAQVFAEAGYLAVVVNGIHPLTGAPNVQSNENGNAVLEWLASDASGEVGDSADLTRVAMAGHSQGSAAALSYQGDPRVDTILAWDGGDSIADVNTSQPIMYQRTDGAFSAGQNTARTTYPEDRYRGLETYTEHKARGLDVMHLTFRATNHIDWNGNGVGSLAGNRFAELLINYYSLAWLDRHLSGLLVTDEEGDVVTSGGRSEREEREYRQARAQDAFDRLTALQFDDSVDKHNISMGFFDPQQAIATADPLYGGNVPYAIEGLWVTDRLAQEYVSYCSISVPNYHDSGHEAAARADTGPDGDMRFTGCPVTGSK